MEIIFGVFDKNK